jgi:mannosyltransferase
MGDTADIEIIIPNLHWRYSGVTATNRMIAPRLARLVRAGWLGRDKPEGIEPLSFADLLRLRRPPRARPSRLWHARRNDEMIIGVILKWLGWPLALVFTSSAQRRHSAFTRFLINRMDVLIASNPVAASFLTRKAVVVLHGVDTVLYSPPADRAAAFREGGLPGRHAIGTFGRVRPQKGSDVFVAAMCRLLPRFPDFSAVLIGLISPEHRAYVAELRQQIAAAGLTERVRFLGELPIEEVPVWYKRISIYAFASRNEGFGLTLLEASRAGAAAEVVTEATGVLVPVADIDALVAALEPLMREPDLATAMGARARKRAVADFSIEAEAERIAAVYRRFWDDASASRTAS